MSNPAQDEIVLVTWRVWYPARHAYEVVTRRYRSTRDAARQVSRIPEWPFSAHLIEVWRAPVGAWEEVTGEVERFAAELMEERDARTQDTDDEA